MENNNVEISVLGNAVYFTTAVAADADIVAVKTALVKTVSEYVFADGRTAEISYYLTGYAGGAYVNGYGATVNF